MTLPTLCAVCHRPLNDPNRSVCVKCAPGDQPETCPTCNTTFFNRQDNSRAEAWKRLALDTRKVVGDSFSILADACNLLDTIGDPKTKAMVERIEKFVNATNIPVPGPVILEIRRQDKREEMFDQEGERQ